MLKTEPVICKTYYNYVADQNTEKEEFKRFSYRSDNQLTLIHYKGDDSVVESDPHVRTCPSVLRDIQQTTQSPSVVYKKTSVISICHDSSHYDVVVISDGSIPTSLPPGVFHATGSRRPCNCIPVVTRAISFWFNKYSYLFVFFFSSVNIFICYYFLSSNSF